MKRTPYDRDRTLRVVAHMAPEGHSARECAAATGAPVAVVRDLAKLAGFPFSEQFGPASRCRPGKHLLAEVGYREIESKAGEGIHRRCLACVAERQRNRAPRARPRPKPRRRPKPRPVVEPPPVSGAYQSQVATNAILDLIDAKGRAGTPWEREAIQAAIDEWSKQVTV